MSDERSLKTATDARNAYGGAMQAMGKMLQASPVVAGWLQDTREIAVEWITAACGVKFKNAMLDSLWGPLADACASLSGPSSQAAQTEVLARVKECARTLAWARLLVQGGVREGFAESVLAAVRLLESIDETLAKLNGSGVYHAFMCFETISVDAIIEPPNPYEESKA